jgi:hypothetical protein
MASTVASILRTASTIRTENMAVGTATTARTIRTLLIRLQSTAAMEAAIKKRIKCCGDKYGREEKGDQKKSCYTAVSLALFVGPFIAPAPFPIPIPAPDMALLFCGLFIIKLFYPM